MEQSSACRSAKCFGATSANPYVWLAHSPPPSRLLITRVARRSRCSDASSTGEQGHGSPPSVPPPRLLLVRSNGAPHLAACHWLCAAALRSQQHVHLLKCPAELCKVCKSESGAASRLATSWFDDEASVLRSGT
eukprot:5153925-Prymnesium_polylepis.2